MGMYTELVMAVELAGHTPKKVVDILEYMCHQKPEKPEVLPDHPLFKTDRWGMMLCCDSAYFPGITNSEIEIHGQGNDSKYYLTIRSNFKDYDYEIDLFLDWIAPYVIYPAGECAGYFRYEEDQFPTLIYFDYMDNDGSYHPVALMNICEGDECTVRSLEHYLQHSKLWREWKDAQKTSE